MLRANSQRSLSSVPVSIWLLIIASSVAQIGLHMADQAASASPEKLGRPNSNNVLLLQSIGEPATLGKLLMLWLQGFDNQPGVSIPFAALDYDSVTQWLDASLALDPKGQYPLLAAARVYAEVPDPIRQRKMLDFVFQRFSQDPERRWPWLAHAAVVAKHHLHDRELALKYARVLADTSVESHIPSWARHMDLILLEEAGEQQAVKILIGGLIESGKLESPQELNFWQRKLEQLSPIVPESVDQRRN